MTDSREINTQREVLFFSDHLLFRFGLNQIQETNVTMKIFYEVMFILKTLLKINSMMSVAHCDLKSSLSFSSRILAGRDHTKQRPSRY